MIMIRARRSTLEEVVALQPIFLEDLVRRKVGRPKAKQGGFWNPSVFEGTVPVPVVKKSILFSPKPQPHAPNPQNPGPSYFLGECEHAERLVVGRLWTDLCTSRKRDLLQALVIGRCSVLERDLSNADHCSHSPCPSPLVTWTGAHEIRVEFSRRNETGATNGQTMP